MIRLLNNVAATPVIMNMLLNNLIVHNKIVILPAKHVMQDQFKIPKTVFNVIMSNLDFYLVKPAHAKMVIMKMFWALQMIIIILAISAILGANNAP